MVITSDYVAGYVPTAPVESTRGFAGLWELEERERRTRRRQSRTSAAAAGAEWVDWAKEGEKLERAIRRTPLIDEVEGSEGLSGGRSTREDFPTPEGSWGQSLRSEPSVTWCRTVRHLHSR